MLRSQIKQSKRSLSDSLDSSSWVSSNHSPHHLILHPQFSPAAWQSAELWGNLISSLVLSSGAHGSGGGHSTNFSDGALDLCGANFCVKETTDNANLERPPDSEIYMISTIYLACIVAAVTIIALFMDPLSRYGDRRRGSISAVELSGTQLLAATFKQLKKPNQQLLIPLTIFIGMEQAFIGADFTQVCSMVWSFEQENHENFSGLRIMRFGNPPNRLRYDLLRRCQRNLFGRLWIHHEIHRKILNHHVRNSRAHGNLQLLAVLATSSRTSFDFLRDLWTLGSW
jgi:hypothetical protein